MLMEAGRLITAKEAERRVLVLENPGLRGKSQITGSLYAGLQLVLPGEVTSQAGWPADTPSDVLGGILGALQTAGVRVALFVDPEPAAIKWAKAMGADRVELYTEPFAKAFDRGPAAAAARYAQYVAAAHLAGVVAHPARLRRVLARQDCPGGHPAPAARKGTSRSRWAAGVNRCAVCQAPTPSAWWRASVASARTRAAASWSARG